MRLWNPARLDPAFPPSTATLPSSHTAIPQESLPRALPIQVYADGITHPVSAVFVDVDASTLATASDKTLVLTDVVTQRVKRRFQGHVGKINAVANSLSAETWLSASYDATVRIWDGRSSYTPIQILKDAKDSVTDVHVVQNNEESQSIIRTASVDGIVRSYDLRKGVIHCDDVKSPITGMTPTRDGQCLVISCLDGCIRLMELESGQLLNTYKSSHVAGRYGLQCCVTADDSTIVSGSEDGSAVLYDVVRATCVQKLTGHVKPVCSVAVHPLRAKTHAIITASYDGTATVWAHDEQFMGW